MALRRPAPPRLRRPAGAPLLAPTPPAAPAPRRRTGRRAVLLVGAATAVTLPVVAGALLRGRGSAPSAARPFADVAADAPGAEAMAWAHETGVQPAVSATAYAPAAAVTRADVALVLHRFAGAPAVPLATAPAPIADLCEDPAQAAALIWLHGRGALWGDAELRVHPEQPATRDGAAMMLAALLRPALTGVGVSWDAAAGTSLAQDPEPGSALPDVAWLEAAGITPPVRSLADWAGQERVTRANLAVAVHRADAVIADALA